MGAVIFLCRFFPFLFFNKRTGDNVKYRAFLNFVEKTVPPVAMTVLAFNSMVGPFRENPWEGIPILAASAFTALLQILRRNPLISIFGGPALYMFIARITGLMVLF
jgi:branched-subunit amino acid transport protein AzlD